MRCPFCGHNDTQVKDSRPTDDNSAIRRRRSCPECGARWTTFERVQLRELIISKKNDKKEPFDRDKLARSLRISLQKRPVDPDQVERVANSIQRRLESLGENEVPSKVIGEMVMDVLANLDSVAYVRFASVYRNFREARDFEDFIGNGTFAVILYTVSLGLAVLNVSQIKTPKLSGHPINVLLLAAYTLGITTAYGWKLL